MTKTLKKEFTVDKDGEKVELAIVDPSWEEQLEAQDKYNMAFKRACDNKALLRPKLDDFLKGQEVWSVEKEAELTTAQRELNDLLYELSKGTTKDHYKELIPHTYKIKAARRKVNEIVNVRDQYFANTAEGQAENMRFACLLASAVVYKDSGKRYWPTVEAYLADSSTDIASEAATQYAAAITGTSGNPQADLPENRVLQKLELMDKNFHYLREGDKKPYAPVKDDDGSYRAILVDEEGRFINEEGEPIDINGHRVNEKGQFSLEVWGISDKE